MLCCVEAGKDEGKLALVFCLLLVLANMEQRERGESRDKIDGCPLANANKRQQTTTDFPSSFPVESLSQPLEWDL